MKFFKKVFDHEYKQLESFKVKANQVLALENKFSKLSDEQLQGKTKEFKERLKNGETLEDILERSRAIPFTEKTIVDKEEVLEIIKDVRLKLPDELKQAKWIKEERERIIAEAQKDAEDIVKNVAEEVTSEIIMMNDSTNEVEEEYIDIKEAEILIAAQNKNNLSNENLD